MKYFISFFLLILIISSCKQAVPTKGQTREMFDAGDLHVITSFANRKDKTMSIIYGNEQALQSALTGYRTHFSGACTKLVVYKQADNKYWYGSYQNGKLISVEFVKDMQTKEGGNKLSYSLEQGEAIRDAQGNLVGEQARINYIFSHRPSVFP